MDEPVWLTREAIIDLHAGQIERFGGLPGVRDEGLLDAALARPRHQFFYGNPNTIYLAAAYAFGLAKNHAFHDGNKRISYVATRLFLESNDLYVRFPTAEGIRIWRALADGEITEEEMAVILVRQHAATLSRLGVQ